MNPLSKHAGLDDVQLNGMIAYAQNAFPYLEVTSIKAVTTLSNLMIRNEFMFSGKPTPIRSSFEFLKKVYAAGVGSNEVDASNFSERDFVFAIKMFGLRVREKNGVNQFVPDNVIDDASDGEITLNDRKEGKELEFYVSEIQKHTKIQRQAIESATNRLLRKWREVELACLLAKMMQDGKTIGEVKEHMRQQYDIKDNVFVRIRTYAIEMDIFKSKQTPRRANRRITLDEDIVPFVEELQLKFAKKKKLTASQAVNQGLRDLRLLTTDELPAK